jgi:hypothetical protein
MVAKNTAVILFLVLNRTENCDAWLADCENPLLKEK